MLGTGLEPARLTARASKTRMSAIPSPERGGCAGLIDGAGNGEASSDATTEIGGRKLARGYAGPLEGRVPGSGMTA